MLPVVSGSAKHIIAGGRAAVFSDSAAFSPDSISGMNQWFAADAITASDNDPVTSWSNEAPTGNDLIEATNPPTYQTNEQNGLPGVLFDGTNDRLTATVPTDASKTVFLVIRSNAGSELAGRSALSWGNNGRLALGSSNGWAYAVNAALAVVQLGGNVLGASLITLALSSVAALDVFLDGVLAASFDPNDAITNTTFALGFNVGGTNLFFPGLVFELIGYDSALGANDRAAVESYLTDKWGL